MFWRFSRARQVALKIVEHQIEQDEAVMAFAELLQEAFPDSQERQEEFARIRRDASDRTFWGIGFTQPHAIAEFIQAGTPSDQQSRR